MTVPRIELSHLDDLWFQVAGTLCNLTCHHCFISCHPKNHNFGFLTLDCVKAFLAESVRYGVKEYYFTGGEPFLNPELVAMLKETLRYGPATVLTNGTVLKDEWLDELREAETASPYSLELRISIDGYSAEMNDPIRGERTFERAMFGVRKCLEFGFLPIITIARTWDESDDEAVISRFEWVLKQAGCSRPRLKILPTLRLGAEVERTHGYALDERVSAEMLVDYDRSKLICDHSRIVTDRGVHVCPILVEAPESRLGSTLTDSRVSFALRHGACWTCYQFGAICSNPSATKRPV
jgi:MoaA/NifB/PqqE/SkfB family radical SAM enzyme